MFPGYYEIIYAIVLHFFFYGLLHVNFNTSHTRNSSPVWYLIIDFGEGTQSVLYLQNKTLTSIHTKLDSWINNYKFTHNHINIFLEI